MPEEPLKYTHIAREEDEFTYSSTVIFAQTDFVQTIRVGCDDKALATHYLVFSRRVKVDAPEGYLCDVAGYRWGEELVAYQCDELGNVYSWGERAVMRGPSYNHARDKLTYALQNNRAHWEYAPDDND